jgi:nicotinate-nucleotide--dimethylbenzimidazole phosphoribosyltransferase
MIDSILQKIRPLDDAAMKAAAGHQGQLALPPGSLGKLHEISVKMAGMTGCHRPEIKNLGIITLAGDHGVAAQGVSQFPQAVTREMVMNFARGGAAINVLTGHVGARLTVVNMGVSGPTLEIDGDLGDGVRYLDRSIAPGTRDISIEPAMCREEAIRSVETGIEVFLEEKDRGLDAVGTGDMGIGNTTPSSAVAAAMLKTDPALVVNRGTGINDEALKNKIRVVTRALDVNQPDPTDPLDVLAKVGGFEIGGITGVILAACAHRVPVVVDGFISTAGALLAAGLHPHVKDYLFSGHQSAVEGHRRMLDALELSPLLNLEMRLGEGTGAVLGLSLLAAASRISTEMLTFEEASVSGAVEN